jgi:cysteine dioxygenase
MDALLERCRRLAAGHPAMHDLVAWLLAPGASVEELSAIAVRDVTKPYGRRVLFSSPRLEVMLACWNAGRACAPHDHGGSMGVVRLLQGRCVQTAWRAEGGRLTEVARTRHETGEILACGAEAIHALATDPNDPPMITLHAYTAAIGHMVVYDTQQSRTLVVPGDCGAWVPDHPLRSIPGYVTVEQALAA